MSIGLEQERQAEESTHVRIAVVGTGFAGLGMAIRLKQDGIDDFVVLERAQDVGGTWRDNTYPGCACDVPSHLYSFSFAPNPDWTRTFSSQPEIWGYLRGCAERFGVTPHIRYGHELLHATWDGEAQRWSVETSRGALTADVLVLGTGPLSEPAIPDVPGLDSFRGTTFHSARWDHDHDLSGERVAVIGTGASAIQFVPQIQPQVARLHLFQRTPAWVVPRPDRPVKPWARRLFRRLPVAQALVRAFIYWLRELSVLFFKHPKLMGMNEGLGRRHLERSVTDPELRARLTPSYRMGCKRILISDDYYPAVSQPNVEVVTEHISEVRPTRSSPPVGSSARSTPSSSAPVSTSPTSPSPTGSRGTRGWCSPTCGGAAPRPTWARRSPAIPTCSCWWGPTRGWATRLSCS